MIYLQHDVTGNGVTGARSMQCERWQTAAGSQEAQRIGGGVARAHRTCVAAPSSLASRTSVRLHLHRVKRMKHRKADLSRCTERTKQAALLSEPDAGKRFESWKRIVSHQ